MLRNKKVRYLVLVSFCFYLIALINDSMPMFVLCWATLSLLAVAWVLSRLSLSGLVVERRVTRPRAFAGEPLPMALRLGNEGTFPKSDLLLQDLWHNETLNLRAAQNYLLSWLGGTEWVSVPGTLKAPHRGRYRLGPARAQGSDPWGIFEVQSVLGEEQFLVVYPRPLDLPAFSLRPRGDVEVDQISAPRPLEEGLDFRGIREYHPGDDLRRVHWKATAHAGRLYIREFEKRIPTQATVVLDLHGEVQYGSAAESTVECGVVLAASVCRRLLQQGYHVRFLAQGGQPIDLLAGETEASLYPIFEILAVVTGTGTVPLERLLRSHGPSLQNRTILLLITASTAPDLAAVLVSLHRRGVQVLVIALVPSSFLPPPGEEWPDAEAALGREETFSRPRFRGRQRKLARGLAGWTGVGSWVRGFMGSRQSRHLTHPPTSPPSNAGDQSSLGTDLESSHRAFIAHLRTAGVTVWPFHRGDDPAVCLRV